MSDVDSKKPVFTVLNPDADSVELESWCHACGKNGITKCLLIKIPYYKEVAIMSFDCPHCGNFNNEIESCGTIEEKGVKYTLNIKTQEDLSRQVVKSDYTCIKIPHIEFEIPSKSQKGEVTTVEGIIDRAVRGLQQYLELRKEEQDQKSSAPPPEETTPIDEFIEKLKKLKNVEEPYTMILEDPSGVSWIENPHAPGPDPNCKKVLFTRSKEEDHSLGIYTREEVADDSEETPPAPQLGLVEGESLDPNSEVFTFLTNCPACGVPADTHMKLTKIPHFKEVVIMATSCDSCGHRTNEVKSGCGIEKKGVRIEVKIASREDFSRDLLKSETCSVQIPELEIEAGAYVVGGKFTTVEGLVTDLKEGLSQSVMSDSVRDTAKESLLRLTERLGAVLSQLSETITLILDDPAGNSYVQSLALRGPDPRLKVTYYERTFEQNEELGLNDMVLEGYETQS